MRMRKAGINAAVNFITVIAGFLPAFIVRKQFLDTLGAELLGLTSLFSNIVGLLALAELGIGSAIVYALYKPFAQRDAAAIQGYLRQYAKLYRLVGCFIACAGLAFMPFLHLFVKDAIPAHEANLYFAVVLADTVIGYFFSYKLCLLVVAQEGYRVTLAVTGSKLTIALLQLALLELYPGFFALLCVQLGINLIYYIAMNAYINRKFAWVLKARGVLEPEARSALTKNVRALFMHKIGGTLVFGVDNMVISAFINLTVVGIYNSYAMIVGAVQTVISSALSGVTASIGNLLTEGSAEHAYAVHKRLFFISFWIVSTGAITLSNTLDPFVRLWLGPGHELDRLTVAIVLVNFYFMLMRGSVERFKEAAGIYRQDRYAPLLEAAVNLGASLLLVQWLGLPGVFLGTLVSNLAILFWLKPMLVYRIVFKRKLVRYFAMYASYALAAALPLLLASLATAELRGRDGWGAFALNCALNLLIVNGCYLLMFWRNEEFRFYRSVLPKLVRLRPAGRERPNPTVREM